MIDFARQRIAMVESQVRTNDVTDPGIVKAMGEIARERFVPAALSAVAYMESPVPLAKGRVLADPRCFAKLAQLAAIRSTDRVLDVACGTGYSTAVLSHLAAHVTGLEEDGALALSAADNLGALHVHNAEIVHAPLVEGWHAKAPYDVIFINGGIQTRPSALLSQLGDGGRLVCVQRNGAAGHGCLYLKHDESAGERAAFDATLPVLPGFKKELGFVF